MNKSRRSVVPLEYASPDTDTRPPRPLPDEKLRYKQYLYDVCSSRMSAFHPIALLVLCASVASGSAASAGLVNDQLDKAKTMRADELARARTALIEAIDAQVKAAGAAGDLDLLRVVTTQKDEFVTAGLLPNIAALKDAGATYTQSARRADGKLVEAYEDAIEAYTTRSMIDRATVLRKERNALLEGTTGQASQDSPAAVGLLLERAKADYRQAVADAKHALVLAIEARIDASSDAGDLNAVTSLQAARAAAQTDAAFADGFSDAAVLSAESRYCWMVQSANRKLGDAYRDAIRGYTRARAIEKAEAVQAEFDATGIAVTSSEGHELRSVAKFPSADTSRPKPAPPAHDEDHAPAADGVYRLNSDELPPGFSATGTYSVSSEGLEPFDDRCLILTKEEDFLSKEFVFEARVDVPRKQDGIILGLGDGTDHGSLRLVIRPAGGSSARAFLALGDRWGKPIGDIREAGPRLLRIERHGTAVTVSVGTEKDGKFEAEISQTIADPKSAIADLGERRAHLFFTGKTVWSQVRLATGVASGTVASAPARGTPHGDAARLKADASLKQSVKAVTLVRKDQHPKLSGTPEVVSKTNATEAQEIIDGVAANYPDLLKDVKSVELVKYHDASEFRRYSGARRRSPIPIPPRRFPAAVGSSGCGGFTKSGRRGST